MAAKVARLLVSCPDRPGIVAAVTGFLYRHGANIIDLQQHSTDPEGGRFFMRLEFDAAGMDLPPEGLRAAFTEVARRFGMDWRIAYAERVKRTAILVSKADHALLELLWRWRRGELATEVTLVIGNHPDLAPYAREFGVPFFHVPVAEGGMAEAEAEMLRLLKGRADLVVLARYMRILSADFVGHFPNRIINIHHSFLPAFAGARPYHQAYARGVKIIGATAHYVTPELDAGPIIEQDVVRVSHRDGVRDLIEKGRDLERQVLARAVKWHLEDRILVYQNKTVVFA